jgi:hypothetical protein
MSDIDMNKVQLNWCVDLLKRIQSTLDDANYTDTDKITAIAWLVKQALKVERDD